MMDQLQSFKLWFEGFAAATGDDLDPEQWTTLKARIGRLPDKLNVTMAGPGEVPNLGPVTPCIPRRLPDGQSPVSVVPL